jgi:hypothetical protein
MDNLDKIITSVEDSLKMHGFQNVQEIIQTANFEEDPVYDESFQIFLSDPSLNSNEINFRFIARPRVDDEGYSIQQITAAKEFRPNVLSKRIKTIQQSYNIFPGIPNKEQIIHEMLLQIRHERNRQDLAENNILRKQLTKMGFNYDQLVASSFEIISKTPKFKGVTIIHEELPILGDRPENPGHVSFVLRLRKSPKLSHQLESIYTSVNNGLFKDGASNPELEYEQSQGNFPTRFEMTENLSKLLSTQFSKISNAQQLFHLIKEASKKKPKNILGRFQLKGH